MSTCYLSTEQKTHLVKMSADTDISGKRLPDSASDDEGNKKFDSDISSDMKNEDSSPKDLSPKFFNGVEISKLTKSQMKKYQKCLKWEKLKKEKRAKERLKNKEKKQYAREHNIDLGPSRKKLKQAKMKDSPCKTTVVIDLSFDDLMIDKDMAKTVKQILRVYTLNRRAKAPMQLHLTSYGGRSKKEMERHHGYEHWDINFHSQDYLDIFPKSKLVYLSSESDNVLQTLEEDKVYVIGGLVDHNAHKGICYDKAVKQGIAHAQLPISEYFWMKDRKILTINQVFEILLGVSEGKTFKEAFEEVLPQRKQKIPIEDKLNDSQAKKAKLDGSMDSIN